MNWKASKHTLAGYPCVEMQGPDRLEYLLVCPYGEIFSHDEALYGVAVTNRYVARELGQRLAFSDEYEFRGGGRPFCFPKDGLVLAEVVALLGGPLSGEAAADHAND